jgi:hypothetical protein
MVIARYWRCKRGNPRRSAGLYSADRIPVPGYLARAFEHAAKRLRVGKLLQIADPLCGGNSDFRRQVFWSIGSTQKWDVGDTLQLQSRRPA